MKRLVVCCALLLLAASSACAPLTTTPPPGKIPAPPVATQDQSLAGQAERAWTAGNMPESERLYGILGRSAATPDSTRNAALERFVQAALVNRHPQAILDGLDMQRRLTPDIAATSAWQQHLGQGLMLLPASDALRRATGAAQEQSMPLTLRAQAASVGMVLAAAQEKVPWMETLNTLYQGAGTPDRQTMERGLYVLLPGLKPAQLTELVDFSLPDTDQNFPWSVVLLEQARREDKKLPVAPTASSVTAVERLGSGTLFADPALRAEVMSGRFTLGLPSTATSLLPGTAQAATPGSTVPMNSGCVALALPLSGNFAAVGKRVALGAEVAKQELAAAGVQAEVVVLDTMKPDWLDRLAGLPPQCAVVGGPLEQDVYSTAKAGGALTQRTFFTFMSTLESGDEGVRAWRFFSSPEDQVSAMLRAAGSAGVNAFAVLYPEEPYGRRMATLFQQAAGSRVLSTAGYGPTDTQSWNGITRSLVGGHMRGTTPVSSAQFQGLFMPDSWEKSATLIPFLFFHGEDRLLLMGSALWEQGINRTRIDPSNTTLVIFPGGWNSVTPSASASTLMTRAQAMNQTADSWMGLGYDFVRFALALNLTGPTPPAEVNSRVQTAGRMSWSMAPLSWSPDGRASQSMFVFSPRPEGGLELMQPEVLKQKLEEVRARYQRRMGMADK